MRWLCCCLVSVVAEREEEKERKRDSTHRQVQQGGVHLRNTANDTRASKDEEGGQGRVGLDEMNDSSHVDDGSR